MVQVTTYRLVTPVGSEVAKVLEVANQDTEARCALLLDKPKAVYVTMKNGQQYIIIPEGCDFEGRVIEE
jgi:hypothetical protein